jgi:SAM-dependent methyltransferase
MSSRTMMVEQSDERDAVRARLAGMWSAVAEAGRGTPTTPTRAARRARSACSSWRRWAPATGSSSSRAGPGGLGLAAAERVGPGGEVVLSDVAEEMTAIAAARGAELGLGNIDVRRLEIERIDEPDASYDVVLCREGLMFALEPGAAVAEIRRVLRPGGRAVVAGVGGARAQPVARPAHGRGQRADRGAGAAARDPRPLRPRRRRRAAPALRRRRPGRRARRSAVGPAAHGVVRRVVGADVGARRPAVGHPRVDARGGRAGPCASAPVAAVRPYETATGGLDLPGETLIAAGRRA